MITSHGVRIKCFTLLNVNKQIHASAALHVKPYADFLQVRIGLMNSLKAQAEETILTELVFS